ncbi:GNAT family N-acetyltransferase [Metabacillus idriensis]|uniref:GNAT family N-acetyltransferase n=1 Tax=Metabacillus idriensis TaxID=324768 RepID=UPI00174837D6|nr:GNAT family N-acetyltransferase [Metabacillus idriensis]
MTDFSEVIDIDNHFQLRFMCIHLQGSKELNPIETLYEFEAVIEDRELNHTISLRPVKITDLEILYVWMHQPHIAPFWKLNVSKEDFYAYLERSVKAEHKRVYLCFVDDLPAGYLIAYSIQHDSIRDFYQAEPGDLGMHLLIGPRELLNKEDGLMIVRAMTAFLMKKFRSRRIIGEPDIRNRIVIPILKEMSGYVADTILLPHKKAALVIGEHDRFNDYMSSKKVTFIKLPSEDIKLLNVEGRSNM